MISVPAGLQLSAGTFTLVAPFTQPFIVGSQIAVIAAATQGTYPVIWEFASWSDGGDREPHHHESRDAEPLTATYGYARGSLDRDGGPARRGVRRARPSPTR